MWLARSIAPPASQVRIQGFDSRLSGKVRYSLSMTDSSTTNVFETLVIYF